MGDDCVRMAMDGEEKAASEVGRVEVVGSRCLRLGRKATETCQDDVRSSHIP